MSMSILEFDSNVPFSAITQDEIDDVERVQKTACKLILRNKYTDYKDALQTLNLDPLLGSRREKIALQFAKGCTKLETMNDLFQSFTKM